MFLCRVYPVQLLPFISKGSSLGGIYKLTNITLTITLQWPLVNIPNVDLPVKSIRIEKKN